MARFNLIEEIAKHIEWLGFGTVPSQEHDGDIYWGTLPNYPDDAICVFSSDSQYGGSSNGARIQIYVRARTTRKAYELSQDIAEELIDYDGFLCGDGAHVSITPINVSCGIGTDGLGREIYTSNFTVMYCNY